MIITYLIMGICIIVYGLQTTGVVNYIDYSIIPINVNSGEWYRLITGAFLHGGLYHIAVNMISLCNLGSFMEPVLKSKKYLILLLVGLVGSGGFVAYMSEPHSMTVGFSGVIFAIFGCYIAWLIKSGNIRDYRIREQVIRTLITNAIISLMPGISLFGHLGGLIFGFIYGIIIF